MSNIVLTGKIEKVFDKQSGVSQSGNAWSKQEYLILHEDGQYQKRAVFSVFGEEKIQKFAIVEGETITVSLTIDARMYKDRYYNSIDCWKVQRFSEGKGNEVIIQKHPSPEGFDENAAVMQLMSNDSNNQLERNDGLPF